MAVLVAYMWPAVAQLLYVIERQMGDELCIYATHTSSLDCIWGDHSRWCSTRSSQCFSSLFDANRVGAPAVANKHSWHKGAHDGCAS